MRLVGIATAMAVLAAGPLQSQTSPRDAAKAARAAQARFEVERVRRLPRTGSWSGGVCDERLGRMCLNHEPSRDWWPVPEHPRIAEARDTLLAILARAQLDAPRDPWILGQRVFYLGESGRWHAADSLVSAVCASDPDPWCLELRGLALHSLGSFAEAERAFRAAHERMPPDSVRARLDPEALLDHRGRGWLRRLPGGERATAVDRIWRLADPLLLVPGNDRLTEHFARGVVARLREDVRNPYGMSWGGDLEELLIRYGWEIGWEAVDTRSMDPALATSVVGHHEPESRPLVPSATVLQDAPAAGVAEWALDVTRPREAYAPAYAPVLLPADAQVAVFRRGDRVAVVAETELPEDTTWHAKHEHPQRGVRAPWLDAPAVSGLFLIGEDGAVHAARSDGSSARLILEVPAGRWVASVETWDPALRRAGRTRVGVDAPLRGPDEPTISDLLLTDGALGEGSTLTDAAARALGRGWVRQGEPVGIAWELFGLPPGTALSYSLTAERTEGLVRRAARALRLVRPDLAPTLEWQEVLPGGGPVLRGVEISLAELEPGVWTVRLEVRPRGLAPLVRERTIELRPAARD